MILDSLGMIPRFFLGYKDSPVSLGVKTPTFYTCAGTQQLHSIIRPWPRKNEPGFDLCHGASIFHATEAMAVSLLQLGRALALRPRHPLLPPLLASAALGQSAPDAVLQCGSLGRSVW